jgi:D-alanyl-D-alanine carboxypeptidase
MKFKISILFAFTFVTISFAQKQVIKDSETAFQKLLHNEAKKSTGVSMTVFAPNLEVHWSGAAGFDNKKKDQKLNEQQPFRIASITKTFTAAAILRLAEMGELNINDPILSYISDKHKLILNKDAYNLSKITIKHCLQHTSGIFDYAVGNDDYVKTAIQNPKKRWTRTEQIQFAIDHGNQVGKPGKVYHYSDTGYVILGEIIERLTGKGLAEANRELLNFEKLELTKTWLQSLEPKPKELLRQASSYLNEIDATHWDNSVDLYGGGGYVSTTDDLAKFYHGLFNGKIFEKPETLQIMLSSNGIKNQGRKAESYTMGLWKIKTPYGNGYMHDGFWGSAVIHFPDYNATIALNYVDNFNNNAMKGAFKEIVKLSKEK